MNETTRTILQEKKDVLERELSGLYKELIRLREAETSAQARINEVNSRIDNTVRTINDITEDIG